MKLNTFNTHQGGFGRPFKMMALLAAVISTFSLQSQAGVSSARTLGSPAIISTPRLLEQFPWLGIREVSKSESIQKAAATERALARLASNHALAASPRFN